MNVTVKKTHEISREEIYGIHELFEGVFGKKRDTDTLLNEYTNSSKGYSYHAIATDNNTVVGHNVYVPFKYLKGEQEFYLALSIDAMVHPNYRGKELYSKMVDLCGKAAAEDGCKMRIGFPNDNSYPIQVKKIRFNDIGRLDTYFLPVNIGKLSRSLRLLNPLSRLFAAIITALSKLSSNNTREYSYKYRKDRADFDLFRYKWFGGDYTVVEDGNLKFIYRDSEFKGKRATFLMDVFPLSKSHFDKACRYIYNHEKHTPLILYVGNLPFRPLSMLRIPHCIEPKHFNFVGKIFDPDFFETDVLDIKNWELNLSNYDLL